MIKGNKGEWSEYYAFLKLLSERRLNFGGPNYSILEGKHYPILCISRTENEVTTYYDVSKEDIKIVNGSSTDVVVIPDLKKNVAEIFDAISSSPERTFGIGEADDLMVALKTTRLNANNQYKQDLTIKIHDLVTNSQPEIGFSVKSLVGSPATLLNASGATNFIYEIKCLSDDLVDQINNIDGSAKIRDRLNMITSSGGKLEFVKPASEIFHSNLKMCDSVLPDILALMVLYYYSGRGKTLEALSDQVIISHNFGLERVALEYKLQNLLYAIALGMVPDSPWNGEMKAYGGYIIVKQDGGLVGYNVYNADIFRRYLLKTTKLDTPSSTRHKFGKIYLDSGKAYINLNLQIRFQK